MGVGKVTATTVKVTATVKVAAAVSAIVSAAVASTAMPAAAPRKRCAGRQCGQSDRNDKLRDCPRHDILRAAESSAR
jgi:hypothetical protein